MIDRSQLLLAEDAAAVTGVTPATLRDWTRRGLLPRYGTARRAMYRWQDLATAKTAAKPRRDTRRTA